MMKTAIQRTLLYCADRSAGFHPTKTLRDLDQSQFKSRVELEALQIEQLRTLLCHAEAEVPYYRDIFRSLGFRPSAVKSVEDISCLPIVNKRVIMQAPERFISSHAPLPHTWLSTSGSTGDPFRFIRTRNAQSYKIASRLRFRSWYNIGRTDPQLILNGAPKPQASFLTWSKARLHFYATNRWEQFAAEFSDEKAQAIFRLIEEAGITSIMGFPTGVKMLADFLSSGHQVPTCLRAIFTNGENLFGWMRRSIAESFNIVPRNDYVATEGSIAHECPSGGLHTNMEESLVELVPMSDDQSYGRVVVTFLHTFDFPLIRYEIGDVARWDNAPCACGRELRKIDSDFGRYKDRIKFDNGRYMTAAELHSRIFCLDDTTRFPLNQIVQTSASEIELRVLDRPRCESRAIQRLEEALHTIMPLMKVTLVRVNELPREPGGKFRAVICHDSTPRESLAGGCDPVNSAMAN